VDQPPHPEPISFLQFRTRDDNIGVIIHDMTSGICIAVDASEAAPMHHVLQAHNWTLTHLLITHAHNDHIAGISELKKLYDPHIISGSLTASEIGGVDHIIHDDESIPLGALTIKALHTPGHRSDHMCFWLNEQKLLFCGDVLFKMGCGRTPTGDESVLWQSIQRLVNLPHDTRLSCGHDYMLTNTRFALTLEPDSSHLKTRLKHAQEQASLHQLTSISTLGTEKQFNPFLRTHEATIKRAANLSDDASPEDVFVKLRRMRNQFS
jgi:hydroxyacylglutathione hydrolase